MNDELEKMKLHSPDWANENIRKLAEIFPHCVTEKRDDDGMIKRAIDYDQLRQELSDHIVDGPQERYHLNWPGKRKALLVANAPIAKTLRPARDESVNFDTTQNLFIEGDNLEALKLLQETYLGKVKMIYIDPPYNTGNDFIYEDDFAESANEFLERSNQKDDEGNRLVANPDSKGRFHSGWLSMMYSRLRLARSLLSFDGLIVISISDHEVSNLKNICDEIFGKKNNLGNVVWNSTKSVTNTALISVGHTHNLIYAKDIDYFVENRTHFRLPEDGIGFSNPDNDPRGPWKADPFQVGGWRPNQQYVVTNPNTGETYSPNPGSSWKNDLSKFQELLTDNRIVFGSSGNAGPQRKRFLHEAEGRGKVIKTWWDDVGTTTNGTAHLKKLFDDIAVFSNPKPVDLIKRFVELCDHTKTGIILDFFAGSGTTAEAVMKANAEGARRKFIIVQVAEKIDSNDKSNSKIIEYLNQKELLTNLAEISKERIRRAGAKILEGERHPDWNRDIGFRVLKVDTSNMKVVYYRPDEVVQSDLLASVDNIEPGRTGEDLLFQVLVDWGVDLTLPIRHEKVDGKSVYFVNDDALIACFETGINVDFVKQLATRKPLRVVFRDNGFTSDDVKANVAQIFRQTSPDTDIKVI